MSQIRIVGLSPKFKGQVWDITQESYLFGRVEGCGIQLVDGTVSSKHASLTRQAGGAYVLKDEGSTNGTKVNGNKLSEPYKLANGDVIQIGGIELMFENEGVEMAPPAKSQTQTVINLKSQGMQQRTLRSVAAPAGATTGKSGGASKKANIVFIAVIALLTLLALAIGAVILMNLLKNKSGT